MMMVASSCSDFQHLVMVQILNSSSSYHPSLFEINSGQHNIVKQPKHAVENHKFKLKFCRLYLEVNDKMKVCKTALIAKDGENHAEFFFKILICNELKFVKRKQNKCSSYHKQHRSSKEDLDHRSLHQNVEINKS